MNYPQGLRSRRSTQASKRQPVNYANRGMSLEEDINATNQYYLTMKKALVHKIPTPIQIVNIDYPKRSAAKITEGYFRQKATTDYNGVYRGKYIDFEAKETKNKTSFPLVNFHEHQIEHMRAVLEHDGICFVIIRFTMYNETYLIPSEKIISHWDNMLKGGRKSIPFETIKKDGYKIPFTYNARVDYLSIVQRIYFE
ncbi:MAG TPA: Holliday junction resolvase RecU [Pseudogracilibacillus sp.]|nr:Holliday junction resolvase RecU [Pseudogracilibacillus sp.]